MAGRGVHDGAVCDMHNPQQTLWLWHTVNERVVCILLECILVIFGVSTVADPGGEGSMLSPPGPVKLSHKKDDRHRFHTQWRIQDFPEGGVATSKVDVLTYYFGRILHENEIILTSCGGAHPQRPP